MMLRWIFNVIVVACMLALINLMLLLGCNELLVDLVVVLMKS